MSLCKFNIITLLENKDNRFYSKNIKINSEEENYININFFANDIIKQIVGDVK